MRNLKDELKRYPGPGEGEEGESEVEQEQEQGTETGEESTGETLGNP